MRHLEWRTAWSEPGALEGILFPSSAPPLILRGHALGAMGKRTSLSWTALRLAVKRTSQRVTTQKRAEVRVAWPLRAADRSCVESPARALLVLPHDVAVDATTEELS